MVRNSLVWRSADGRRSRVTIGGGWCYAMPRGWLGMRRIRRRWGGWKRYARSSCDEREVIILAGDGEESSAIHLESLQVFQIARYPNESRSLFGFTSDQPCMARQPHRCIINPYHRKHFLAFLPLHFRVGLGWQDSHLCAAWNEVSSSFRSFCSWDSRLSMFAAGICRC